MKKWLSLIFLVLALLCFVGCGKEQEKLNWSITILEQQVKDKLEVVDEVRQYDGSIAKVVHKNVPAEGKKYLLLHLDVKKNVAGNNGFNWEKLELQGKDSYKRTKDIFISDYKYKRLPATELKLDAKGWICFEMPKDAKTSDMKLVYEEQGKRNSIALK